MNTRPQSNKTDRKTNLCRILSFVGLYAMITFIGLELSLRFLGFQPHMSRKSLEGPIYHQEDLELGWKFAPGQYDVPVNRWGHSMHASILPEGGRATTSEDRPEGLEKLVFIGGSFTFGSGLNDDQVFTWKLQSRFKNLDIRNLGVGAYGTYQSLIVLEQELKKEDKPKAVIYGYIGAHRFRNVAHPRWLQLVHYNSRKVHPKTPYVTLNDLGEYQRQVPIGMTKIPFSEKLVTLSKAETLVNKLLAYRRVQNMSKLTQILVLEMQRLCLENDVKFYLSVFIKSKTDDPITDSFIDENQISYIDSQVPLTHKNTIRGDGHPIEAVHDIWAQRIGDRLIRDNVATDQSF
ncbi:hypothetical protein [Arenicella xantha]|uniref:SGNH/GDSL hydrolase family protein n=1 Tax=Arenicella xantha TaxID=644221 RepID=A0A395JMS6_9GAMM|nr:hypothetical protein [Arenicella xantha]RBP52961.1 hypothetical protein DFR28_101345 [Arenicella xantha]